MLINRLYCLIIIFHICFNCVSSAAEDTLTAPDDIDRLIQHTKEELDAIHDGLQKLCELPSNQDNPEGVLPTNDIDTLAQQEEKKALQGVEIPEFHYCGFSLILSGLHLYEGDCWQALGLCTGAIGCCCSNEKCLELISLHKYSPIYCCINCSFCLLQCSICYNELINSKDYKNAVIMLPALVRSARNISRAFKLPPGAKTIKSD